MKCFLPLFALISCTSSSPWQVSHLPGAEKEFDSARLTYPVRDKVNEVAVEMIYTKNQLRTYLVVHTLAVPPYQGDPQKALVTLKIPEQSFQEVAARHQGGQRISLPPHLQDILVETLASGHSATIELQGYSTQLSPNQFSTAYEKMKKNPLNIPVQLTFKL